MTNSVKNKLQELYKSDDYLWLQQTIELLKIQDFENLDFENLIEELESLGRSEFNKVRSLYCYRTTGIQKNSLSG